MINPAQIRKDFPIFTKQPGLHYLDTAASSLKPQRMLDAVCGYYADYSSNIHRGLYPIAEKATGAYEDARATIARFIGADTSEIIFTRNATEGVNLIATGLLEADDDRSYGPDDPYLVTTVTEHHANFVPWQQICKRKNRRFSVVPADAHGIPAWIRADGSVNQEILSQYVLPGTRLVAFSAVSNVTGNETPVRALVDAIRSIAPDVIVVIDAAQALPHMPVSVGEWNADYIVASGHKMCGPTGIGFVWGTQSLLNQMHPYQFGGAMINRVGIADTTFAPVPQRFEAGTPHIAGAIGLAAAVSYLEEIGLESIHQYERELGRYAYTQIKTAFPELSIVGPQDSSHRNGILSFTMPGFHAHDVAQIAGDANVAIRAGHHCAMPLHEHLKTDASVRASLYIYNTEEDIAALISALSTVTKILSR